MLCDGSKSERIAFIFLLREMLKLTIYSKEHLIEVAKATIY